MHISTALPSISLSKVRENKKSFSLRVCFEHSRGDTSRYAHINEYYSTTNRIYILDKEKIEILIVEVGIRSFDNLRTVTIENKHKYDLLANVVLICM